MRTGSVLFFVALMAGCNSLLGNQEGHIISDGGTGVGRAGVGGDGAGGANTSGSGGMATGTGGAAATGGASSMGGAGASGTGGASGTLDATGIGGAAGTTDASGAGGSMGTGGAGGTGGVNTGGAGGSMGTGGASGTGGVNTGGAGGGTTMPEAGPILGHPWPNHTTYAGGIKPQDTQTNLDNVTAAFYDQWKASYLATNCPQGNYYRNVIDNVQNETQITTSQTLGDALIITAIMAGYDPAAQSIFDSMYRFLIAHPSRRDDGLFCFRMISGCGNTVAGGPDSATDGDVDIAYALLLAARQWGSAGATNYLSDATRLIANILARDIDPAAHRPILGDWATDPIGGCCLNEIRTSYYIPDHFLAFGAATNMVAGWQSVVDASYSTIAALLATNSMGLTPDYITNINAPAPLPSSADEPNFSRVARYAYRLGVDYVVNGEPRGQTSVRRLNAWIRTASNNVPTAVLNNYQVNGTPVIGAVNSFLIEGPLGVSAMVDSTNQTWLNAIWQHMASRTVPNDTAGYDGDTNHLLAMIVMSGNWWKPQ